MSMKIKRALHALYWTCLMFMVLTWIAVMVTNTYSIYFWASDVAFLINGAIMWKLDAWSLE